MYVCTDMYVCMSVLICSYTVTSYDAAMQAYIICACVGSESSECVYLNGNGTGLQPVATKKLVNEELQKWKSK